MNRLLLLLFMAFSLVAHAQVPDYVPTEGLVAWYPFNGNANDESGNGNDGVNNGATPTLDRFSSENSAYYFSGSGCSTRIDAAINTASIVGELTISVWVLRSGNGCIAPRVMNFHAPGDGPGEMDIGWDNSGFGNIGSVTSTSHVAFSSWTKPADDIWTQLIYVNDGSFGKFYQDGALFNTVSSTGNPILSGNAAFGRMNHPSYDAFNGKLDDIGIWNRALTAEEILALYNAEPPVLGCTESNACNFDAEATSDDGSCIPSGCMELEACNYNALAECEGEACDYTCCPGPGCCGDGMYWDYEASQCAIIETCQDDLDGDGVIGVNDLMQLLSSFGTDCPVMFTCGDLVNYHGHDYATVQIGGQCWFAENLATASYRNGEGIAGGFDNEQWAALTEPGQSVLDNLEANANVYGRFYNWFAVNDERRLCPMDWHLPTHSEWNELTEYLGGVDVAGGRLKSSTNDEIQWNGTNDVGFGALPNGYRNNDDGEFLDFGETTIFWASTQAGASSWYRMLQSYTDGILSYSNGYFSNGYSVRCIKD